MLSRIMVPLDGSPLAERALGPAAQMVRAVHGTLHLVRVISLPLYSPYGLGQPDMGLYLEAEQAAAGAYLQSIAMSLQLKDLTVERTVLSGLAAPSLIQLARDAKADLLVLTSQGRTGMARWVLGSVAQQVTRHAPVPVLVLHADGALPAASPRIDHLTRVLVGLDGSPFAEQALGPAVAVVVALVGPGHGGLHLLHVVDWLPTATQAETREFALQQARTYLTAMAQRLDAAYGSLLRGRVTWSLVVDLDAAAALIRAAETGEDTEGAGPPEVCDLIAVATHGRSGILLWAMGSTAERVLGSTKLPLLLVRATEPGPS